MKLTNDIAKTVKLYKKISRGIYFIFCSLITERILQVFGINDLYWVSQNGRYNVDFCNLLNNVNLWKIFISGQDQLLLTKLSVLSFFAPRSITRNINTSNFVSQFIKVLILTNGSSYKP